MKEVVRKHVQDELSCLSQNREAINEIGELIRKKEYTPTREYLALLKRVVRVQTAIENCNSDIKRLYVLRYKKDLSWVAVSLAMNVSEITAKRYNRHLIEEVAKQLGWI